ncbi:MAG: hypothetical protein QM767_11540 [Anaeromyxobacter sp.]
MPGNKPSSQPSKQLNILIDAEIKDRIVAFARRRGCFLRRAVADAIASYLANEEKGVRH